MKTGYTILRAKVNSYVLDREDGTVDWDEDPGYETLSQFFRLSLGDTNAWMERVTVYWPSAKPKGSDSSFIVTDMLVDEEGMLKRLPVNAGATALYHQQAIVNGYSGELSPICGTAIVFHRRVWF